jgi:excisionase family DNA binding protein
MDTSTIRPAQLEFYTVAEVGLILNVSQKLVFSWVKNGALPAVRLGPGQRLIRIRRQDLEVFLAQGLPDPLASAADSAADSSS